MNYPATEAELIPLAAKGEYEAQSRMAMVSLLRHGAGKATLPDALAAADRFARMAVASTPPETAAESAANLAAILLLRSHVEADPATALEYYKEGDGLLEGLAATPASRGYVVAILSEAADAGHEAAALRLNEFLESLTPGDAVSAKEAATRLEGECLEVEAALRRGAGL